MVASTEGNIKFIKKTPDGGFLLQIETNGIDRTYEISNFLREDMALDNILFKDFFLINTWLMKNVDLINEAIAYNDPIQRRNEQILEMEAKNSNFVGDE